MLPSMALRRWLFLLLTISCCKRASQEDSSSNAPGRAASSGAALTASSASTVADASPKQDRAPFPLALGNFRFGMNRSESAAACQAYGGKEDPRSAKSSGEPSGCSPVRLLGVKGVPVVDFCGEQACAIGFGLT